MSLSAVVHRWRRNSKDPYPNCWTTCYWQIQGGWKALPSIVCSLMISPGSSGHFPSSGRIADLVQLYGSQDQIKVMNLRKGLAWGVCVCVGGDRDTKGKRGCGGKSNQGTLRHAWNCWNSFNKRRERLLNYFRINRKNIQVNLIIIHPLYIPYLFCCCLFWAYVLSGSWTSVPFPSPNSYCSFPSKENHMHVNTFVI